MCCRLIGVFESFENIQFYRCGFCGSDAVCVVVCVVVSVVVSVVVNVVAM